MSELIQRSNSSAFWQQLEISTYGASLHIPAVPPHLGGARVGSGHMAAKSLQAYKV